MPLVTSQSNSVAHYYDKLAPYLGVSPDRKLFVELAVDVARRCAPYFESVCPFLKPIDRKARSTSCTASVFLQEKDAVQRNCRLNGRPWTGIELFYIGGRSCGCPSMPWKRERGVGLPQKLPSSGIFKIPQLYSATSDEWILQASFRQIVPIVTERAWPP